MTYTILGSSGFVGRHLIAQLRAMGETVITPARDDQSYLEREHDHLVYCIGLTADFRTRPFDTVDSHVCLLNKILKQAQFKSFTYLSSTRVYAGLTADEVDENSQVLVDPQVRDQIYNISKLAGEAACFAHPSSQVRVLRLSNVHGEGMSDASFLGSLCSAARREGKVTIRQHPDSAKDYLDVQDLVRLIPKICQRGEQRLYHLASGRNTSHRQIAEVLQSAGVTVAFPASEALLRFPRIRTQRIETEFGVKMSDVLAHIPAYLTE